MTSDDGPAPGSARPRGLLGVLGGLLSRERPEAASPRDEDVTPIPPPPQGEAVVELRPVNAPFAFVRILRDEASGAHRYEVLEPALDASERAAYDTLRDAFVRTVDVDLDRLDRKGARAYLAEKMDDLARRRRLRLDPLAKARVGYHLERDLLGYGPIDALMRDGSIEDVSCDGPGLPLFLFHRKLESMRTNVSFGSDDELDAFVMRLVQRCGRHISVAEPLVDATLPDGSRLQASLAREVTTRGSTFTIRKFREDPLTPADLLLFETASPEMMAYLWLAVEHGASLLICGGTASGKTTSLNALSVFVPPQKKVVSIEDTREIHLAHENWIPGVTRAGGSGERTPEGKRPGEVDMFDLLKAALRQRPEYLIVGEVRGAEAYVLFQAMATGHTVLSTMHADGVASAVHRLESKPIEIPRNMLGNLDVVLIQGDARVDERRVRKVKEIVEITGIDPRTDELLTNRAFHWDTAAGRFRGSGAAFILDRIAEERRWSEADLRDELARRASLLSLLAARGVRDLASVSRIVSAYAADPRRTYAELEAEPRA